MAREEAMAGKYFGICDANHGVIVGWKGPLRETEAEAEDDCRNHKSDTYDHKCEVEYDALG